MLFIELTGTPFERGRAYGEQFRELFMMCVLQYAGSVFRNPEPHLPRIHKIIRILEKDWPDVLDETRGMAEGANIKFEIMVGFRFRGLDADRLAGGCAVVYLKTQGGMLGRNADLSERCKQFQICVKVVPDKGLQHIYTTYLGFIGCSGMNEAGLGAGGASADTTGLQPEKEHGPIGSLLNYHLLSHCRTVEDAKNYFNGKVFFGGAAIRIVADNAGNSMIVEQADGQYIQWIMRDKDQDWQVCTNFFQSGKFPINPDKNRLGSAYARYGRAVHRLTEAGTGKNMELMEGIMTDIAQPGQYAPEDGLTTTYSTLFELGRGKVKLAVGHPRETGFTEEVKID